MDKLKIKTEQVEKEREKLKKQLNDLKIRQESNRITI